MINIVLVQPEIPHNTGAIGRVCVGLGARLHLIKPLGFQIDDTSVKRSGLDYWEYLDVSVHVNWQEFLEIEQPKQMLFCSTRGESDLYDCKIKDNVYLVFGSETSGLPPDFYESYKEQLLRIPMPGEHARSINLANAASVVAYEAFRQLKSSVS